jgi:hypothetical protein
MGEGSSTACRIIRGRIITCPDQQVVDRIAIKVKSTMNAESISSVRLVAFQYLNTVKARPVILVNNHGAFVRFRVTEGSCRHDKVSETISVDISTGNLSAKTRARKSVYHDRNEFQPRARAFNYQNCPLIRILAGCAKTKI